jgi:branched-chain amino acid transport system permease protein
LGVALVVAGGSLRVAQVVILTESLQFALFACATNLLVGYGGLVSFGQGAFYGTGAYVIGLTALHLQLNFWVAFIAAPFVAAGVALAVGLIAVRTSGLYFALLTLAFAQLLNTIALLQNKLTNGSTGIFGHLLPAFLTNPRNAFLFVLVITAAALGALWWITISPFGLTLQAIRENRDRAEALGVNVFRHQLLAFVLSGFFCGIAGALFVVYDNAAYPALLNWVYSGYPVFMAVIGGMFSFLGPALGAFIYTAAYTIINNHTGDWQLIFGAVLLVVALFMPDGLVGIVRRRGGPSAGRTLAGWLRLPGARRRQAAEEPVRR